MFHFPVGRKGSKGAKKGIIGKRQNQSYRRGRKGRRGKALLVKDKIKSGLPQSTEKGHFWLEAKGKGYLTAEGAKFAEERQFPDLSALIFDNL